MVDGVKHSALGRSPLQTDYEDYREVDGVKRSFVQRQARPDFVFVIKWDSIKHNVSVDEARFEKRRLLRPLRRNRRKNRRSRSPYSTTATLFAPESANQRRPFASRTM